MRHSTLQNCFRRAYRWTLYSYPADFRRQYAAEMSQVFNDRCRAVAETSGRAGLLRLAVHTLGDGIRTAVREWIASAGAAEPPGRAQPASDGVPVFQTCENALPRTAALVHGGLLTLVVFSGLSFAISHGGARRGMPVRVDGSTRASAAAMDPAPRLVPLRETEPQRSLWSNLRLLVRSFSLALSGAGRPASAGDRAKSLATQLSRAMQLDRNGDGRISPEERTGPYARDIRELLDAADRDRDGVVTAEEVIQEIWRRAGLFGPADPR